MKSVRIPFDDSEKLRELISNVYFGGGNNGKLSTFVKSDILVESPVLKLILSDMSGYLIKVTNEDVISGSMAFGVVEKEDEIFLVPKSVYCIKKNEDKDIYSFY